MHSLSLLQEALWKEQQQQGDKSSKEDLLQPSIKRLVDSSHVCLRKGVLDLGRRLKVSLLRVMICVQV
jgi:hypothetical protein